MQLTNTEKSFGWVSIVFHWSLAVLVIFLFALGWWMVDLDYYSDWYHRAPDIHKSVGVLVMGAMLLRFIWNLFNTRPAGLDKPLMNRLAHFVHLILYLLVFALGVSGYLISTADSDPIAVFDWFEVPALIEPFEGQGDIAGDLHEWFAYGLMGLVGLHALAAIKHHVLHKNLTLKRMVSVQH